MLIGKTADEFEAENIEAEMNMYLEAGKQLEAIYNNVPLEGSMVGLCQAIEECANRVEVLAHRHRRVLDRIKDARIGEYRPVNMRVAK